MALGVPALGAIRENATVALTTDAGESRLTECSATWLGPSFVGFAASSVADGEVTAVVTVRGSVVAPIVEGGGDLDPSANVFLSLTLGEVAMAPPSPGVGRVSLQVGVAIDAATMTLVTDARYGIPG